MSVTKQIKGHHQIGNKVATSAQVKSNKTDKGGTFYTFDMFDDDDILLAKNRYAHKGGKKQPFDELTEEEELILNPAIVINEDEAILDDK